MKKRLTNITPFKAVETECITPTMKLEKKLAETVIMAQEAERKRLGQELHDNVNQLLATAQLFLERLEIKGDENFEFKNKASQYIDMAVNDIRSLSHSLVVPHFEKNKLTDSCRKIVNDIKLAGAFTVFSEFDEKVEGLDHSKKMNLFRILQEQLKNTIKYSYATLMHVRLFCDENNVHLIIRDNGVGFDSNKKDFGSGLYNIFGRAELCGGTAIITTAPGCGCKLEVIIPLCSHTSAGANRNPESSGLVAARV